MPATIKKEVGERLKSLERALFGSKKVSKKWWFYLNFRLHVRNLLYIFQHANVTPPLVDNFKKTVQEIGLGNITWIILQLVHTIDEMAKINQRSTSEIEEIKAYDPFQRDIPYRLPEPEKSDEVTSYQRFNRVVDLKEPDRVPITPLMDYFYAANNNLSAYDFVMAPFKYVFAAVRNTYQRFNGELDMVHVPMGRLYTFYNWLPLATSGFYGDLHYPDKSPSSLQFLEKGYIDIEDFEKIKKLGLRSIWKPVNIKKMRETVVDLVNIGKYIDYWEKKEHVPIYATSGILTPLEGLCYLMGIKKWLKAILKNKEEMKQMCDFLLEPIMANNYMM
ncbi:MAG: hypothetical protein ACOC44_09150 [Promethearchaeia archaeon]